MRFAQSRTRASISSSHSARHSASGGFPPRLVLRRSRCDVPARRARTSGEVVGAAAARLEHGATPGVGDGHAVLPLVGEQRDDQLAVAHGPRRRAPCQHRRRRRRRRPAGAVRPEGRSAQRGCWPAHCRDRRINVGADGGDRVNVHPAIAGTTRATERRREHLGP